MWEVHCQSEENDDKKVEEKDDQIDCGRTWWGEREKRKQGLLTHVDHSVP